MKHILLIMLLLNSPLFSGEAPLAKDAIEQVRYLTVQHEGRVKPLDTVARYALLLIHGSQTVSYNGSSLTPTEWLFEVMANSKAAKKIKLIRIENHDLQALLGVPSKNIHYYSIEELEPYFADIFNQYSKAALTKEAEHDSFERAVILLWTQIATYLSLNNTLWLSGVDNVLEELQFLKQDGTTQPETLKKRYEFLAEAAHFNVLYPMNGDAQSPWLRMGEGVLKGMETKDWHPAIGYYAALMDSYAHRNYTLFNTILDDYFKKLNVNFPKLLFWMKLEVAYNTLQPFLVGAVIYTLVFLVAVLSELFRSKILAISSVCFLVTGFAIHTAGLIVRMSIEGRPPVTNIYSSAIFVGWGVVLFSLLMEWRFRNRIGCIVGAVCGSLTLIVAHHLTGSKDSMEVMRAVLDSNFWLSTHVVAITLGYSSTFLAGALGCLYILRRALTKSWPEERFQNLEKMVYGTVCFSTLLTFTGTILGGIWADQSWGRFWGWDPKENGALLIILWNVLILHAKLGGFIMARGLMLMVVFGNIITSFSWFGVNMLGVGLHSYGFIDGAFLNLGLFVASQLVIMAIGCLPRATKVEQ